MGKGRLTEWEQQRINEIKHAQAALRPTLLPALEYGWEREFLKDEKIKALEKALTRAERTIIKQQLEMKRLRHRYKNRPAPLWEEILKVLSERTAKMPAQIRQEVEETWGTVSKRNIQSNLEKMVQEDVILRTMDGYLLPKP